MANIIVGGIIVITLGLAIRYIIKEKKKGVKCIGCSAADGCSSCQGKHKCNCDSK